MMSKNSLAKKYARRFCEEYNSPNIKERTREFKFGETIVINGESIFGPHETWPAQLDYFSYMISKDHAHREINYETLKNIILLEKPEIQKRNYISPQEYEYTVKEMFEALMIGMKVGKLERIFERKMNEGRRNTPRLLWPFVKKSTKKKVADSLKPISDRLYNDASDYYIVRNLSFNKRVA